MAKVSYGTDKYILIAQDSDYTSLPVQVSGSAGSTIKAGTPLAGDLTARDTAFTQATGADAVGVLLHDVPLKEGETTGNGVIVYEGTIDLLKLDGSVEALITSDVKTALKGAVKFVRGAK